MSSQSQYNRSNAIPDVGICLRAQFKRYGLPFEPADWGPVQITSLDPRDPAYVEGTHLLEEIPKANISALSPGLFQYTTSNNTIQATGKFYDVFSFKFELGGETFYLVNDFTVTEDGLPKLGYVTVAEVRAEGLDNVIKYPDSLVNSRIQFNTKMIENYCGRWFEARKMIVDIDGPGAWAMQLDFPIVSVDSVALLDREFPVTEVHEFDLDDLVIYNRHLTVGMIEPDDREDPRIGNVYFPKGRQNIRINGTFGYTDEYGNTPIEIKRALILMVLRDVEKLNSETRSSKLLSGIAGPIKKEKTDDHEYELAIANSSPGKTAYFTGDTEIDHLLLNFRRPMSLGKGLGANRVSNIDGSADFDRYRGGFDFLAGRSI